MNERLYRSRTDRMIGGVAAGIARSMRLDPTLVRIAWVVLAFVTNGVAILVYFILLFVIPEEPWPASGTEAGPADGPGEPVAGEAPPGGTPAGAQTPRPWWSDRYSGGSHGSTSGDDGRTAALVFGLILVGLGAWFLVRQYLPQIDLGSTWPYLAVGAGILLVIFSLFGGRRAS